MNEVYASAAIIFTVMSLISYVPSRYWLIRAFDYPKVQLLALNFGVWLWGLGLLLNDLPESSIIFVFSIQSFVLACDLKILAPYLLAKNTNSDAFEKDSTLKIMCFNVLIENRDCKALVDYAQKVKPEILTLFETDKTWRSECSGLEKSYGNSVLKDQENGYGLLVYSKFPIKEVTIEHYSDTSVPVCICDLEISNTVVKLIAFHPRPPGLKESTSIKRDLEFRKVAELINSWGDVPVIVSGDLNDVPWSKALKTFINNSKLTDPRREGKGLKATFPVKYPFLRYPLDHIFLSHHFDCLSSLRGPSMGSDHFSYLLAFKLKKGTSS